MKISYLSFQQEKSFEYAGDKWFVTSHGSSNPELELPIATYMQSSHSTQSAIPYSQKFLSGENFRLFHPGASCAKIFSANYFTQ